jgi:hypothetical protein
MRKLRDTEEDWLDLLLHAEHLGATVRPGDGRMAQPLKSLEADGLVKRDPAGVVRITKSGRSYQLKKLERRLLR